MPSDMCFTHRPTLPHGTSLPDQLPDSQGNLFFSSGSTIMTSARLLSAWEAYISGRQSVEDTDKELEQEGTDH